MPFSKMSQNVSETRRHLLQLSNILTLTNLQQTMYVYILVIF